MDAQSIAASVIEKLAKKKELAPIGEPISIHPIQDFSKSFGASNLGLVLKKLERDHKVIKIIKLSDDDPERPVEFDWGLGTQTPYNRECYKVSFLDGFDNFVLSYKKGHNAALSPFLKSLESGNCLT